MAHLLLALAAACGIRSAAGSTDDAQVLVQVRSPTVHLPDNATSAAPRVCTAEELQSHAESIQAAVKAQQDKAKQKEEKISNTSRGAVEMHVAPLQNATDNVVALLSKALRPAVLKIVTFGLQKVSKTKKPYSPSALVDVNQTIKDFENVVEGIIEPAKAIFLEGLVEADVRLNHSIESFPEEVKKVFHNHGLPQTDRQVQEYFTDKVMPTLMLDMFPQLAKLAELLAKMPTKSEEFPSFFMSEVVPWAMSELPKMLPEPLVLPTRQCITCQDQYQRQAVDFASGCMKQCLTVLSSCGQGATRACLQQFTPCLGCHRESLAQLDECEGKHEHNSTIAKLEGLGHILGDGSLSQGYDKFLDELSSFLVS